jgi:outer membrane protein assembly factor BamB
VWRTLHGPVVFENKVLVGAEDWALSYPSGQVYDLSLADGTLVGSFPAAGCGAATCTPLVTLDAERDLVDLIVDDGRVVATSSDDHLVAFGLPS